MQRAAFSGSSEQARVADVPNANLSTVRQSHDVPPIWGEPHTEDGVSVRLKSPQFLVAYNVPANQRWTLGDVEVTRRGAIFPR